MSTISDTNYLFKKESLNKNLLTFKVVEETSTMPLITAFKIEQLKDNAILFKIEFAPGVAAVLSETIGITINKAYAKLGVFGTNNSATIHKIWNAIQTKKELFIGQEENLNISPLDVIEINSFLKDSK